MTTKQKIDLETIKFFIPAVKQFENVEIIEQDEIDYLKFSENAIKPVSKTTGYESLFWGKKYRGIHTREWEQGLLEGSVPYWVLLGGEKPKEILPRHIVDFMKKEMFKGIDD